MRCGRQCAGVAHQMVMSLVIITSITAAQISSKGSLSFSLVCHVTQLFFLFFFYFTLSPLFTFSLSILFLLFLSVSHFLYFSIHLLPAGNAAGVSGYNSVDWKMPCSLDSHSM